MRAFWTVLATGFTLAVIALSMTMNFEFGYGLGTSPSSARILGALSVACDALKALLPLFVAWQWAEGQRLAALAGAVLFALLLAYGTASAVGFAAENRTLFTTLRDARSSTLGEAIADLAEAEARRAALPSHRLRGVIEADLAIHRQDRGWASTRGCAEATLNASRAFCKEVERLRGELAIADEEIALSATIARLKPRIQAAREGGEGRASDPQALAIGRLTGLDPDLVRTGLAWLLTCVVEAISAFGLFAIRRSARSAPPLDSDPLGSPWRLAERQRVIAPANSWRLTKAG